MRAFSSAANVAAKVFALCAMASFFEIVMLKPFERGSNVFYMYLHGSNAGLMCLAT